MLYSALLAFRNLFLLHCNLSFLAALAISSVQSLCLSVLYAANMMTPSFQSKSWSDKNLQKFLDPRPIYSSKYSAYFDRTQLPEDQRCYSRMGTYDPARKVHLTEKQHFRPSKAVLANLPVSRLDPTGELHQQLLQQQHSQEEQGQGGGGHKQYHLRLASGSYAINGVTATEVSQVHSQLSPRSLDMHAKEVLGIFLATIASAIAMLCIVPFVYMFQFVSFSTGGVTRYERKGGFLTLSFAIPSYASS